MIARSWAACLAFWPTLGFAAAPQSQKSWVHPAGLVDSISPGGSHASSVRVVQNAFGDAVVAWVQGDGTQDCGGGGCSRVYISERVGGQWQHPVDLSDSISLAGSDASRINLAIDDNGDVVVAWRQRVSQLSWQLYRSERRGGQWSHPADLGDHFNPPGSSTFGPVIAMNNLGQAIITWVQFDRDRYRRVFRSEYGNGQWRDPATINDAISQPRRHAFGPGGLAMDDHGDAIVTWSLAAEKGAHLYRLERRGSWGRPQRVSLMGSNAEFPTVAMSPGGSAIMVWVQGDDTQDCHSHNDPCDQVFASIYDPLGKVWSNPAGLHDHLSPSGSHAGSATVCMDVVGNALVTWAQKVDGDNHAYKAEYIDGAWRLPINQKRSINPPGSITFLRSVMGDERGALVAWRQTAASGLRQVFLSQRFGYQDTLNGLQPWQHPLDSSDHLSLPGTSSWEADVAMNGIGEAVVAWVQEDGMHLQVFVSEYR